MTGNTLLCMQLCALDSMTSEDIEHTACRLGSRIQGKLCKMQSEDA